MPTVVLIGIAGVFYALFEILASRAAGKIDDYLSNVFINGVGTILPLIIFLVLRSKGSVVPSTKHGLVFSVLSGCAIAAFLIIFIKIFARGGNLAYVIPIIYGLSIVISSFAGWFVFKQATSLLQVVGVITVVIGIGCIVAAKA